MCIFIYIFTTKQSVSPAMHRAYRKEERRSNRRHRYSREPSTLLAFIKTLIWSLFAVS